MILISHRGNFNGVFPDKENSPSYVNDAIKIGYDVEIDVWYIKNKFFLGHDSPKYEIDFDFLRNKKVWCHCKNIECVEVLVDSDVHFFWHENDRLTLTSRKIIWAYPNKTYPKNSIAVLPEIFNSNLDNCIGVCSDYISHYN
jgi:hypothetical protein